MSQITDETIFISKPFLRVIKSLLKVYGDMPDKNQVLIFKKDGFVHISAMNQKTLVSIKTTESHIGFKPEKIGITNLNEFLKYIEAINYPENQEASIKLADETTTKGRRLETFLFSTENSKYRMPIANPAIFNKKFDEAIPKGSAEDTLQLASKFVMSELDSKLMVKDMQLVGKPKNFNLLIADNKISFYMKGSQEQQFSKVIPQGSAMVYNDFTTISTKSEKNFKIFPTTIFDYMAHFACEFNVEVRFVPDGIMALKCRGLLTELGEENIEVFIGTQENDNEVCDANLDLVQ
jgi:hypothetical protein